MFGKRKKPTTGAHALDEAFASMGSALGTLAAHIALVKSGRVVDAKVLHTAAANATRANQVLVSNLSQLNRAHREAQDVLQAYLDEILLLARAAA